MYGSSKVNRDVPKLPDLYKRGELKLDELIYRGIKLEEVNDALTANGVRRGGALGDRLLIPI